MKAEDIGNFSRRGFLGLGFRTGALLALGGTGALLSGCSREVLTAEGYVYLRPDDVVLLRALLPALLIGSLPQAAEKREPQLAQTLRNFDGMCARLEPPGQKALYQLFDLMSGSLTRRLATGVDKPWQEVSEVEAGLFVERWRQSGVSLYNAGYRILAKLGAVCYFAMPETWSQSGYPGPLPAVYEAANAA